MAIWIDIACLVITQYRNNLTKNNNNKNTKPILNDKYKLMFCMFMMKQNLKTKKRKRFFACRLELQARF